jgi:hypothetical protein
MKTSVFNRSMKYQKESVDYDLSCKMLFKIFNDLQK